MTTNLKTTIQEDMKSAMRAKQTLRLGTIRMLKAAIKKEEIDRQVTLSDSDIELIIIKMIKQRKDSEQQFLAANRQELAEKEQSEIQVLQEYLPEPLSPEEVNSIISEAIKATGATSMQDMGKVIGKIRPDLQGKADMSQVSQLVKEKLQG